MTQSSLPDVLRAPLTRNVELLLDSRIPARLAWVGANGEPRVVPIWFHWTGTELVMATFTGSRKLNDLHPGTVVAVTIDTESFPYRSLKVRGPLEIVETDNLADEYRYAASRYLGPTAGAAWCASLDGRSQAVLRMRPTWAVASDMSDSPFLAQQS